MDSSQLSELVVRLTDSAISNPVSAHQKNMIDIIAEVVKFDAAWWGWSYFSGTSIKITNSNQFNLPSNFESTWMQTSANDPLVQRGRKSNHYAIRISLREQALPDSFKSFGETFKITALLNGHWKLRSSGYHFFMSLYRFADPAFSLEETQDFHVILRHLEQSLSLSLMHSLMRRGSNLGEWALIDLEGKVVRASDGFSRLIQREFEMKSKRSVDRILARIARTRDAWIGHTLALVSETFSESFLLIRATERDGWKILSKKERQIAELFAQGLTHTEIAALQRISPNTVRNQIASIYRKLQISRKTELVQALHHVQSDVASDHIPQQI